MMMTKALGNHLLTRARCRLHDELEEWLSEEMVGDAWMSVGEYKEDPSSLELAMDRRKVISEQVCVLDVMNMCARVCILHHAIALNSDTPPTHPPSVISATEMVPVRRIGHQHTDDEDGKCRVGQGRS